MHQDYNNFAQENEEDDGWVSRSSRKRHSRSLREIGKQVVALAESELEKIPFGDHDSLREACFTARKMKPRSEELRREYLHIEALMRVLNDDEVSAISAALVRSSGSVLSEKACRK